MNTLINQLIEYALEKKLIEEEDIDYSVNLLLHLFHIDYFERENCEKELDCHLILEKMLDYASAVGLIENTQTQRDLFDTQIMNCIMPRPSEVVRRFKYDYSIAPNLATKNYYELSLNSLYIRKYRVDKNIGFRHDCPYGYLEITINLSKPEKDPKEIAKAKEVKQSHYPKCALCKENVGFSGDLSRPARQTHRIIPLSLEGEDYYLQYSPYVYYNEHCIVFNKQHIPMVINERTFKKLISFINQFPHYMLGSNADLPIVGGSILTHDHFQGGNYHFPIQDAKTIETIYLKDYPNTKIEILNWPLSTIRVTSSSQEEIVSYASHLLDRWKNYNNEKLNILSFSDKKYHNTITPIARRVNEDYQFDLVLRNNRTSDEYPDGIFHPHQNLHHIKKENIGLIEVMGLAILPGRLKNELKEIKEALKDNRDHLSETLSKHEQWYQELRQMHNDDIDSLLKRELTLKFTHVLEDAGVFKMNDQGIFELIKFIKEEEND